MAVAFTANHQPAVVIEPGEHPLDFQRWRPPRSLASVPLQATLEKMFRWGDQGRSFSTSSALYRREKAEKFSISAGTPAAPGLARLEPSASNADPTHKNRWCR